ncbi:MAG: glycosyltransferase family 4 protein [Planctomycetota bacterium]
MRILYIAGEVVPGRNGGSVHVWEVATNLARLGHHVTALVRREPGQAKRETLGGVEFVRTRMSLAGRTFPILGLLRALLLCRRGYDLVMDRYVTFGGVGMIFSWLTGIPLVLEVNSPHVEELIWRLNIRCPATAGALRAWVAGMFRQASLVISPLESIVPRFARGKVRQVAWAANLDMFSPELRSAPECARIREEHRLEGRKVVLFLGTFREWHGVLLLPDIIEYVAERCNSARFLFVGDGECLPRVRQEIERRNLADRAAIVGASPYDQVPHYIAASDVGIAPYDMDAYPLLRRFGFFWSPLKIFEYMAGGLPVVTIDTPPLNEIVADGARGRVVPCRDVRAAGDAIVQLIGNDAERRAMGERARDFVARHYNWRDHVRHLNDLFAEIK